ncbi:hypothetical protein INT43_006372 [Umbelopsis isabellina]|uniref:Uncharacterized protein n=1 Tax=Mortierella isabellina TaxID=91625 RepID=A0A8H7UF26_MORIS|nr:hypothetical protein INT43_006372 [Umbelopsis isabellina]
MIEHSYPECTSAVLTGLCTFKAIDPTYRQAEVKSQVVDTAYAILALLDAKYPHVEPIRRACQTYNEATAREWRVASGINKRSIQQKLYNLLSHLQVFFSISALGRYAAIWGDEQI